VIRWLVVGAGGAGRAHAAALREVRGAALAGIVAPEGASGVDLPSGTPVFPDLARALAESGADAVVIATPHDTHLALGLAVLAAGLPLLLEKPVALGSAEARELAGCAAARGVRAGVVLNQRATAHARWIREQVHEGRLQVSNVAFSASLARLRGWHADPRRAGGGVLRTVGIHYVDLLRWWLGEPAQVTAVMAGEPAEDRFAVGMRFPGGALGSVQVCATAERSAGPVRCVIDGAGARLEMLGHRIVSLEGLEAPPAEPVGGPALAFGPGHWIVLDEATRALERGAAFPVPLAEALPTLELIERLYAAARGQDTRPG
jgi:predicted dehydrogenase